MNNIATTDATKQKKHCNCDGCDKLGTVSISRCLDKCYTMANPERKHYKPTPPPEPRFTVIEIREWLKTMHSQQNLPLMVRQLHDRENGIIAVTKRNQPKAEG